MYLQKYLKYKQKYFKLKNNSIGGGNSEMLPKLLHSPFIWVPSSLLNMTLDYLIRAYYISFYLKKSLTKICVVDNAYYEQSLFDKIKSYIYEILSNNNSKIQIPKDEKIDLGII
jgi:hypothetical protein